MRVVQRRRELDVTSNLENVIKKITDIPCTKRKYFSRIFTFAFLWKFCNS